MARNIDSGRLSVMLWGQEIGQLCWNPAKGNSYFYFSPEYLSSGLDIAPLIIEEPRGPFRHLWQHGLGEVSEASPFHRRLASGRLGQHPL